MGRKLCKAGVSILSFNLLLQIAAVATPGWLIVVKGNTESFHSIFYLVTCDTLHGVTCKVMSLFDKHEDNHTWMDMRHTDFTNEDNQNHEWIMKEALLLSAIVCTLVAVFLHILRRDHTREQARIISATVALCGLSAGITVTVSSLFIVENSRIASGIKGDAHFTHSYVGFPYSLTMMLVSVLVHLASMIILVHQLNEPTEKKEKETRTEKKEKEQRTEKKEKEQRTEKKEKEKRTSDIAYIDLAMEKAPPSPPGVTMATTTQAAETDGYVSYRL